MNAIEVRDLHISYKTVKAKSIKKTIFSLKKSTTDEFEAVRGVSFDVKKGEIVGLVGKNGSGKSTLLRSIAGIFSANSGTIDIKGNKVSMLAIGIGFQNELTGKENIYLSGMLMGFTKQQIAEKYDEIVKFSELGDFINAPVKTYSSGMHSKLAFSITAVLETDIMLVDETLSVGDRRFKKKSFAKMKELISHSDRTVIIVSHSSSTINKLCDRVIWLNDGQIVADGETEDVLEQYNAYMDEQEEMSQKSNKNYWYKKIDLVSDRILFYPVYCDDCDDLKYLAKYILNHHPEWKIVWVKNQESDTVDPFLKDVKVVVKGTPDYYRALYSSLIWIDDGFNIPAEDVKKHPEQKMFKFLRGSLGIKNIGKNAVSKKKRALRNEKGKRSRRLVNYCVANSDFQEEVFYSSYWDKKKVLKTGSPRNDILFANEEEKAAVRKKIRERYGVPEQNKIVLYAPTYRESRMMRDEREKIDFESLRKALKKRFGGEWSIFIRLHSAERKKQMDILNNPEVVNVSDYPEMAELLLATDVGITDYSNWIYDYSLLKRPGFLYAPDEERYEAVRGLYYSLSEAPFDVASNNLELVKCIERYDSAVQEKNIEEFLAEKGCIENGTACQQLVDRMNFIIENNME